ncbi:MAG: nucleotidyltransferase family protein [Bryobacteraceae bacterium]|nr:nucleotidyltransferase family protein [Bryobacteraceae bacterium]
MTRVPGPASPRLAGLLLAGGASKRMGSPKALLHFEGETFLNRLIRIYTATGLRPVIVVLGHHAEAIRSSLPPAVDAALNPDPDRGQFSSLQTGLRALPPDVDGVLYQPIDFPAVSESTIEALLRAFRPGVPLVIPRHAGERGHPVLLGAAVIAELLALPPAAQARDVTRRHYPQAVFVDAADAGVVADIDTAEDYAALLERACPR